MSRSINVRKILLIIDGPPASGKTTLARALAQRINCMYLCYKSLGLANIISVIILRLATGCSIKGVRLVETREDPVLLLDPRTLKKICFIIFITEIFYKYFQFILLLILFPLCNCIIVDEFLSLRIANYINVYLNKGLRKWQLKLLIRIEFSILGILAKYRNVKYFYLDKSINKLKCLWYKREYCKEYSKKYLALVRYVWKEYKPRVSRLVQTYEMIQI